MPEREAPERETETPVSNVNLNMETSANKVLFNTRIIVLSEPINSMVAKRTIQELLAFDAADSEKEICIFLNSPGGEVTSGYAIYDTIRFVRPTVKIVVAGLAASVATVILLAAQKKHRYCLPNSRLLIHQPLIGGYIQGQASDIDITAKEILKTRERIAILYQKETDLPLEKIQKDIERDYWLSAQEAKEYGLVTNIVESWKDVM